MNSVSLRTMIWRFCRVFFAVVLLAFSARADDTFELKLAVPWTIPVQAGNPDRFFLFSDEENPKLPWSLTSDSKSEYEFFVNSYRVLTSTVIPLEGGSEMNQDLEVKPDLPQKFETAFRIPKSEYPNRYLLMVGLKKPDEESVKTAKNLVVTQVLRSEVKRLFEGKVFEIEAQVKLAVFATFVEKFGGRLSDDSQEETTHRVHLIETVSKMPSVSADDSVVTILFYDEALKFPDELQTTKKLKFLPASMLATLPKSSNSEIALAKYLLESSNSKKQGL